MSRPRPARTGVFLGRAILAGFHCVGTYPPCQLRQSVLTSPRISSCSTHTTPTEAESRCFASGCDGINSPDSPMMTSGLQLTRDFHMLHSSPVVGWSMDQRLGIQLLLSAMRMAFARNRPRKVIHHSGYRSEYSELVEQPPFRPDHSCIAKD